MFSSMIGRYYPVSSIIHRLNAISKIICTLLFLIILFMVNDLIFLTLLITITLLMVLLSKVPILLYLKIINSLKVLIIFIILINFIFNIPFIISVISIIKIVLGVIYTIMLIFTTTFEEINYSLERILNPLKRLKLPVKQMVLALSLCLKFIPLIFMQAEKILKSQASRGIDFKHSNIKGKILALSSMLLPMFILSLKRADDIADTLELRLYDINANSKLKPYKWSLFDKGIIFIHMMVFILVCWKGRGL